MNALDRNFMNVGKSSAAALVLGVAAAGGLLSGCVGSPIASAKVDPGSPIAGEVARVARSNRDYPRFNEIPAAPNDVLPAKAYGQRVVALKAARTQLDAATAPNTWTLGNTAAFTARARSDVGPAIEPPTPAETEAFVNTIRKRATPPPPANP